MMTNNPKKVILHCSDSPDNMNITIDDIEQWHKDRGFKKIGYHYVIHKDGEVKAGRNPKEVGAHVKGHNNDSIGICWIGRNDLNEVQKFALIYMYLYIKSKFKIDYEQWFGHYEINPGKTCPNLDMDIIREMFCKTAGTIFSARP